MTGVDWHELHARLDRARRAVEATTGEPTPDEVRRTLTERARALAHAAEAREHPADLLELLVFSLGDERYAVDMRHVAEVLPLRGLTPMPCTPPFILGVVHHRGRILPVVDLRRWFGLPGDEIGEGHRIVTVEAADAVFGLLAESAARALKISASDLGPLPAAVPGDRRALFLGSTPDLIAVLDLPALARDPRLEVNEETG
ncbi:MAG: purine-binding chemotaxis protein CheW [Candidatus Rokubacteria bacterium]|nr:purine-binding chemotaxis protein CheW [Candidatus Rokubacteria bacterium]